MSSRLLLFLILVIVCAIVIASLWKHSEAKNNEYAYELERSTGYLNQIIIYCEKCCQEPQKDADALSEIVKNLKYLEISVNKICLLYGGDSRKIASPLYRFCDNLNGVYANTSYFANYSYVEEINAASEEFLSRLIGEEGDVRIEDFMKAAEQYGNRLELIELPMS